MILQQRPVKQSLNKSFRLLKPKRAEIELFKRNLIGLLDKIDEKESEENVKIHLMDFLKNTWYVPDYLVATKGRTDFVIHTGKDAKSNPGVLFEVKRPLNKADMITRGDLNAKAMHELMLYYLRERITGKNIDIRRLVITNIYEWFVFDAAIFERLFAKNTALVKQFKEWESGQKVSANTDLFYNEIAAPFLAQLDEEISFTWFDIRDYRKELDAETKTDTRLIGLFKVVSPGHLLKLQTVNDSNSLNKAFYSELLHIIGLEEVKDGSKKVIRRKQEGKRNAGSLLENTINILETEDSLSKLKEKPAGYGDHKNDQVFALALELCLTWINRILFLKLLEAQLVKYHCGDRSYKFLSFDKIPQYDELYKLFFQVLARKHEDRSDALNKKFGGIPYLNSSLFEISDIEDISIKINSLDDLATLDLFPGSVLRDDKGKSVTTSLNSLEYLLRFLDAYDFASEGSEEIQEESKTLINASVLGLIFEKINGYKDGSIFTPGYITMYMCRQSIRMAVVQKFNEKYGWKCEKFEDLANFLADRRNTKDILEFNALINGLHLCDPAVGSGHFLVSALNEIIAIKSELGILADEKGSRLAGYRVEIDNDELIVSSNDGADIFDYKLSAASEAGKLLVNPDLQRVQKTLFHEKQTIIENCLFGVDINPNSVKICRLRLWIELLKNAYYRSTGKVKNGLEELIAGLETLPNIDINIKCGNSLVSRFALDADLKPALTKSKLNIDGYRVAVATYRNAESKEQKKEMESLIARIKSDFQTEVAQTDPRRKKLIKLRGELNELTGQPKLFELEKEKKASYNTKAKKLSDQIAKIETELEEFTSNVIFKNAFEWRFEFPEVLDDDGNFVGFDVVIGNPPYVSAAELKKNLSDDAYDYLKSAFSTAKGTVDLYIYFFELGIRVINNSGLLNYITPNRFLSASYGEAIRTYIYHNSRIVEIVDYSHVRVFAEASTYPIVTMLKKFASPNGVYSIEVGKYVETDQKITYSKIESKKLNLLEGFIWGWLLNDKLPITEKIIDQSEAIENCAKVNATSTTAEAEEFGKLISEKSGLKLINTGTIDRYCTLWGKVSLTDKGKKFITPYLPLDPDTISQNRMRLYRNPKIVLAKIAIRTEAFYDEGGEFASINTNCFHSFSDEYHPYYVLAWLNSRLFQYTFECFFEGLRMQGGYLLYSAPNISKMFIKKLSPDKQNPIVQKVTFLLKKCKEGKDFEIEDKEIDQFFYQIFKLTDNEIRIVEQAI